MTPRPGSDNEAENGSTPPTPPSQNDPQPAAGGGPAVERIIERFGGIRPMAHKLDIPVTTVQGWKKRGAIPLARHADLRAAAAKHRLTLSEADLEAATPNEDRATAGAAPDAADSVAPIAVEGAATTSPDSPPLDPDAPKPAEEEKSAAAAAETTAPEAIEPEGPKPVSAATAESSTTDTPAPETAPAGSAPAEEARKDEPAAEEPAPAYVPPPVYTPPYTATEERRSGAGFATTVSIIALLVGAAALSEPWWGPRLPGWPAGNAGVQTAAPAGSVSDAALRGQIQQLSDRVAKLENQPAGNGGGAVDLQPLNDKLQALSGRLDQLDQKVQQAAGTGGGPDPRVDQLAQRVDGIDKTLSAIGANSEAVDALRKDVDALKRQVAAVKQSVAESRNAETAAQALVLAAGQLRQALASGQPFQQELQGVRALGISDPQVTQALDSVSAYAAKGVPTQPQLTDRLESLSSDIVRADQRGEGGDWLKQITGKLSTLVTVRREGGGVVGATTDAIVARAEAAAKEGDLDKAVQELSALTGPAAATAAPWIADAKARLAANQAGKQLTTRAIALLSQAAGGAPESAKTESAPAGEAKGNGQ